MDRRRGDENARSRASGVAECYLTSPDPLYLAVRAMLGAVELLAGPELEADEPAFDRGGFTGAPVLRMNDGPAEPIR